MPRVVPPLEGADTRSRISPSAIETIAGFSAGVVATFAVHPFDVLKTRLQLDQSNKSRLGDSYRILSSVIRNEGSYRALYRGLMPNLIGNSASWALYFLWYGQLKTVLQKRKDEERLSAGEYFAASATSGVLTAVCTNPAWVLKTRMLSSGRNSPGAYPSTRAGIRHIYLNEGLLGFYRGLIPSLFGVSHGAVQFMAYEELKHWRSTEIGGKEALTNWDYLTLSGLSKAFAGGVTYPYQVVRARLQTYDAGTTYNGLKDILGQIWHKEGLRGYYKGLMPNLVRVIPSTCVTFLVYENTKIYLHKLWNN